MAADSGEYPWFRPLLYVLTAVVMAVLGLRTDLLWLRVAAWVVALSNVILGAMAIAAVIWRRRQSSEQSLL